MDAKVWLPTGLDPDDNSFAPPLLRVAEPVCLKLPFQFVVPGVLPIKQLRAAVAAISPRLALRRSATRFPSEVPGAAPSWWQEYLDREEVRIRNACVDCVRIRTELASIVIHQQQKGNTDAAAANNVKAARRSELLEELQTHDCSDRESGALTVPADYCHILAKMASDRPVAQREKHEREKSRESRQDDADAGDESESVDEGYLEPEEGLLAANMARSSLPKAYQDRPTHVRKGDFAAVLPMSSSSSSPSVSSPVWMGDQAFWIVRVLRITKHHHDLQWLGDKFLGPYYRLSRPNERRDWVDRVPAGAVTFLHWGIQMVGPKKTHYGKPSAGDLKVLSLDARVLWQLDEHKAENIAKKSKRGKSDRKSYG
jgi:hypothetical protein